MPLENEYEHINSEDIQDIITAVPSWILRWGITLVLAILAIIIIFAGFLQYPDIVKTNLKVNSLNSPKAVLARQSGKLERILIKEGDYVRSGQSLAFIESTASAEDVLLLTKLLMEMQNGMLNDSLNFISTLPKGLNLGEVQGAYQDFYGEFLKYQATLRDGLYFSQLKFLLKEQKAIKDLRNQILEQQNIQRKELNNAEMEYQAFKKLYEEKVISRSEFILQENKYLAFKYPIQQSETSLLNNSNSYSNKEKDILEIKQKIQEQNSSFIYALNKCLTELNSWVYQHVLKAPVDGKLNYAGVIQQNQNVTTNQELFFVDPGNTDFFGEVEIPQYNMGKIKEGQKTLVKLKSYPFEQYGMITGKLEKISEVAFKDSIFIGRISFDRIKDNGSRNKIVLKNGLLAEADIVTEESSLLQRFVRNILKALNP